MNLQGAPVAGYQIRCATCGAYRYQPAPITESLTLRHICPDRWGVDYTPATREEPTDG